MRLIFTLPGDHVIGLWGAIQRVSWTTTAMCGKRPRKKCCEELCEQHFEIWKMKQGKTVYIICPFLIEFCVFLYWFVRVLCVEMLTHWLLRCGRYFQPICLVNLFYIFYYTDVLLFLFVVRRVSFFIQRASGW